MDWFPAVMGLIGVVVGVAIQEFRIWRERKDKYKDMIFEKRLDAHQGAYYRCMRLSKFMLPHELMKDEGTAALEEILESYEWLAKNALYLDGDSRTKITYCFDYVRETAEKYEDEEWRKNINVKEEMRKLQENMVAVLVSIEKGIGVKYLPESRISIEHSELERVFDVAVENAEELMRRQKRKR